MPEDEVADGVTRLVDGALQRNGVAVPDRSPAAVEKLLWAFDDAVWKAQEDLEKGAATQSAYNQAFRRARAMSGLSELLQGRYARAAYEATQALYENEDVALEYLGADNTSSDGPAGQA